MNFLAWWSLGVIYVIIHAKLHLENYGISMLQWRQISPLPDAFTVLRLKNGIIIDLHTECCNLPPSGHLHPQNHQ